MANYYLIISDYFMKLVNVMIDNRITNFIGLNFAYILIAVWVMWICVNIFLIRPISIEGVGLAASRWESSKQAARQANDLKAERLAQKAERQALKEERAKPRSYSRVRHTSKGTFRTDYVVQADGSSESWDR